MAYRYLLVARLQDTSKNPILLPCKDEKLSGKSGQSFSIIGSCAVDSFYRRIRVMPYLRFVYSGTSSIMRSGKTSTQWRSSSSCLWDILKTRAVTDGSFRLPLCAWISFVLSVTTLMTSFPGTMRLAGHACLIGKILSKNYSKTW